MNWFNIKFLIIRLVCYSIITISYLKHNINFWLLLTLFLVIELNVWITFFSNKSIKKSDRETKKLLEDMKNNLQNK